MENEVDYKVESLRIRIMDAKDLVNLLFKKEKKNDHHNK